MRCTNAWLIVLFVTVVSGDSTSQNLEEKSDTKIESTTETIPIRSTTESSASTNKDKLTSPRSGILTDNDESESGPVDDMTVELLLIEKAIEEEEKNIKENNQKNSDSNNIETDGKSSEINSNPENPFESKISKDFIDIFRQETKSATKDENSNTDVKFDDSKSGVTTDPPQRYGQRSRNMKQGIDDSAPFLLLTQGGYEKPFMRPKFRNRYSLLRQDSSEQSENVQKLDGTSNNQRSGTRRIVPYTASLQPPPAYRQGPLVNPGFEASARNMLPINQILPPPAQNGFLNSPPTEFAGYSTTSFQPQFAPGSNGGSFPDYSRDPNTDGVYQALSRNPFQTPGILFQNSPHVQPQHVLIADGRNVQPEFQQNNLVSYPGFETMEDNSSPNYAALFRNPEINAPFQLPSNFYDNTPNAVNPFSSSPVSYVSQYPNFINRVPPQLLQYPVRRGTQNNAQSSNIQYLDSDPSQDENITNVAIQNTDKAANRDDPLDAQFTAGLQQGNVADVYMRYPTIEAGYAIEESLPSQNNSGDANDDRKQTKDRQTIIPNADPYNNIVNSVRSNQRRNISFDFPSELFRSVPIDFQYQRPQGGIFAQYPVRNREVPSYPSRNFESRLPFDAIASLPESFLSVNNQQNSYRDPNEAPSCAKTNNASFCFEDNDYPRNDILYSLNSNPFLTNRLLSPDPSLNSFVFVERKDNETEESGENYACDVVTKSGMPLRAKNLAGMWRIIVNIQERFSQPARMEVCKTLGSSCNYADSRIKTTCVQKYSLQRLLTWSPRQGIYSDVYKIPVACSCQIQETVEST